MQHFTTALLFGDLLTRLHAAFVVSVIAAFEEAVSQRHAFSLARSSGAGDWLAAIWDCSKRLRAFELEPELTRVGKWLRSPPEDEPEKRAFASIFEELDALAARLQLRAPRRTKKTPSRDALLELVLQVRNKTVHGAYESSFYEDHVEVVESAVRWLFANTPLWEVRLVQVSKPTQGRLLHGSRPRESIAVDGAFGRGELLFTTDRQAFAVVPLMQVRDGHTYLANGSWRPADASAEFMCHSLAAEEPGQGTMRIALPDLVRPPLPGVGQVVDGHYRILKILGEGQDAVVYLAADTDEGTEYVLKAFREPRDSFDQRRAEFAALQRINHPGIPRVHEIHSWEHPFHLRMDHVAGIALSARRGDFQGDAVAVTSLALGVCDALDAVHRAGFIHRDIDPDNILIPDDPSDTVRLLDFDLVAEEGVIGPAGTSPYRPPESDSSKPWSKAADVYSLGVVLFELLTGRLPYERQEEGDEPNYIAPTTQERDAFGAVVDVLMKASALEPAARYADAKRLRQAIKGSRL